MTQHVCCTILSGMKLIRLALALSASLVLLAQTASAAEPAPPEHTGLAVGKKAPLFTLKDQANHDVSLESLLKKGPVALVFFRSADW
jgi:cytochrome oxidase Cu insertion factor (SCO1/SenC/PrrC family)